MFLALLVCLIPQVSPSTTQQPAPRGEPGTRPPEQAGAALTGTVLEFYSRRPFEALRLNLSRVTVCRPEQETITTADGRFRFEPLLPCTPPSGLRLWATPCNGCLPTLPRTESGEGIDKIEAGRLEVGTVFVPDDRWATERFAPVCSGEALPKGFEAGAPLIVLEWDDREGRWESSFEVNQTLIKMRPLPWPAVLCLRSTSQAVGRYGNTGGTGYSVETRAMLVRRRDGRRFKESMTGSPPSRSAGTASGDTTHPIRFWLDRVAKANPQ